MQVRAGDLAPQRPGVGQQVHIRAAQAAHLAAAQPGPGHQQHDQPVPRRQARPEQRDDLGVRSPVHRRFRLVQPVPGPHPPAHLPVLAARRPGQVPVISDLIHQRHQIAARPPGRDRVHHHPAHRREHAIDPPGTPRRDGPRPRQHQPGPGRGRPRSSRPGVREPGHEQPELPSARLPGPACAGTPAQEQRDRVRIALRRGLRAVTAEPHLPQEPIGDRHDNQVLIEHRPVPRPGRQPHRERPHLVILPISCWAA